MEVMAHQPARSTSISFQQPFNRAGGRTSNVRQKHMKAYAKVFSALSLFLTVVGASPTDLELKEAFENLREGNPVETVHKSYFVILSAEEKAFPMLLLQKGRAEIAKKAVFQESRVDKDPKTGEIIGLHAPQLGEVALMLIETQVMGKVAYPCWPYRIFDRSNVEEWLGKHKGMPLIELESAAARESLELAEAAHRKEPTENTEGAVAFFKGRLGEIEGQKAANKSRHPTTTSPSVLDDSK